MAKRELCSLDLLLPGSNYNNGSHYSSATSASTPESPDDSHPSANTAAELTRISHSFEEAIKSGDVERINSLSERHIDPDFTARFDTALVDSWDKYVQLMRLWVQANPRFQKSTVATSADVREEQRHATIYILMEVTGWPVQLKRLVVSVLKWRRRNRQWACYENVTMRGIDTFATASDEIE